MRLSRAIPVLVAGAAAVWFLDRRRLLPGQTRPALPGVSPQSTLHTPQTTDPGPQTPDPALQTPEDDAPPAEPDAPAAPDSGFVPSEQPTMEQPAVEPVDAFGAEALDVTAVVDDLIAPAGAGREDAIVDAEVVDDADEGESTGPPSDEQIARVVRDELAQLPGIPAGALSVEVEGGTVILRGEIDRPDTIGELDRRVREVDGVVEIRNLLHLPGTPPPT